MVQFLNFIFICYTYDWFLHIDVIYSINFAKFPY